MDIFTINDWARFENGELSVMCLSKTHTETFMLYCHLNHIMWCDEETDTLEWNPSEVHYCSNIVYYVDERKLEYFTLDLRSRSCKSLPRKEFLMIPQKKLTCV